MDIDTGGSAVEAIYRLARAGKSVLEVVEPTPAVAVIVWRSSPDSRSGIEVYLGQRAHTMRFMPGLWTFPGGLIADVDASGGAGIDAPAPGDRVMARAMAAAIREIEEEIGVVLPALAGALLFAGRLITPEVVPLRFDAALFLAELPAGQAADHRASNGELCDGRWICPARALAEWHAGEWLIPEPTLQIVEALAPGIDGAAERCQAAAARANQSIRAYPLLPGMRVSPVRTPTLPPATSTNCYIIGCRDLLVIDPASPYPSERAALDHAIDALVADGLRVREIWLTHHHVDHVSGAAHLAGRLGVPIAAHAHTARLLGERVRVDRLLEDGDTLELDGDPPRRVRAVFTPGHAPGHLCVFEEYTRSLIAGDMVAGEGTIVVEPTEGDMQHYIESLERMKSLQPRILCPAHGSTITNPQAKLDEYIEHRLWREARVLEAVRATGGANARELTAVAYADVPRAIHPLAQRSLEAHLIKLEREGRVARGGDGWQPM